MSSTITKTLLLVSKPYNTIPKHDDKLLRVHNSTNHKALRLTTPAHSTKPPTPNKHNAPTPEK